MNFDIFYSIPSSKLLALFIVVLVFFALSGLYVFDHLTAGFGHTFDNGNTNTYISIVAIVVALIIAFIVSNEWQAYSKNKEELTDEAGAIYILIKTIEPMKGHEKAVGLAKQYLQSIIDVEFPQMKSGKLEQVNRYLNELQPLIYEYRTTDERDTILYDKSVDLLNNVILLRRGRLEMSITGTPVELWWILAIGFTAIIILTWFLTGDIVYRVTMTTLVAITYASMIFLAISLDFPFKGEFGVGSGPFSLIIEKLTADDRIKLSKISQKSK